MGTRKNAKFLSAIEKENYVKACTHMKADIVNPGDPPASQYSKWDEFIAIHLIIQNGVAPDGHAVNFAHGGAGAFAFLSWHRQFLAQFEQQLRTYFPADNVMLPYWDWTDPASIMTNTFIGPNGNPANGSKVETGYFAFDKPGVGLNATALPAWWPPSLAGWRLPNQFQSNLRGALRRNLGNVANLPTPAQIETTMSQPDFTSFVQAMEQGNRMHDYLHLWLGSNTELCGTSAIVGHMTCSKVSPHDPLFFLHHCNVDRLWAMWQEDGHANEFPNVGGKEHHRRDDPMYPWVGALPGFSNTAGFSIPLPPGLPLRTNGDTLDYRAQYGYSYDTIPIIGVGLDRTGSMAGLTPDPMVTPAPDVTKWEAAKRGVSAFLQDCETVQASRTVYIVGGIKTFRSLPANDFTSIFGGAGYGLIKTGSSFSKATFEADTAALTPGGGTPLADALVNVNTTLVNAPYGGVPSDERRYLAMLTDGMLTSGAPLSSIPNGSLSRTAIFGMGFGTPLDVDYATISNITAKGLNLAPVQQVFHGEEVGTIDKFYQNSLAHAIGFTPIMDPVIELFEGEYTHVTFMATSAEDAFLITAQGMDFIDNNWDYVLHSPNGQVIYGEPANHDHASDCNHCCPAASVTVKKANGRISILLQRGAAGADCWVGGWMLMITFKSRRFDSMYMPELGEMLFPVSAGPIKGSRYSRLLVNPKKRTATRNIAYTPLHGLDFKSSGTNNNDRQACNVAVNVYGRTNLKIDIALENSIIKKGEELKFTIVNNSTNGSVKFFGGFARLISPSFNIFDVLSKDEALKLTIEGERSKRWSSKFDLALLLARFEKEKEKDGFTFIKDNEVNVVSHEGSPLHIHNKETSVRGIYHLGLIVEGLYYPGIEVKESGGGHDHGGMQMTPKKTMATDEAGNAGAYYEKFSRILTVTVAVEDEVDSSGKY